MDLFLFGAGGHARELASLVQDLDEPGDLVIKGVYADWGFEEKLWLDGSCKHLGGLEKMASRCRGYFLVGLGDPRARDRIRETLLSTGWTEPPPIVHPAASVARSASLADGSVVFPGARVGITAEIGAQVHLTVGAIVGHDAKVGESCSVMPGAVLSGNVTIGARSIVGANATILQELSIAADVRIGAGAVVTRSVTSVGATVVGVPARMLGES